MSRLPWIAGIIWALAAVMATPATSKDTDCAVPAKKAMPPAARGLGEVIVGARGGRIEIVRASGLAHLELPAGMTPDSMVRIASLTKPFTAVAVLALAEDGSVSLDGRLEVYLPDPPRHWRAITVRQLLSHTSGLTSDMTPVLRHMKDDMPPENLVALFARMPLASEPGTAWRYSNLNYWILGLVIERVTATSYADYVRNRVLRPAGLTRTRYGDHRDIIRGRAAGYEIDQASCVRNARYFSSHIGYAAGGFISSPTEMAQWYDALGRGRIISQASVELALTAVKTEDGAATGFGLGWYVDEIDGHSVAHHGGTSIGYSSYVYWSPKPNVFAGVFRNWSDDAGEPKKTARDIYDRMRRRR
jgi:D-alanyl-D-alanine carboxypeptidase